MAKIFIRALKGTSNFLSAIFHRDTSSFITWDSKVLIHSCMRWVWLGAEGSSWNEMLLQGFILLFLSPTTGKNISSGKNGFKHQHFFFFLLVWQCKSGVQWHLRMLQMQMSLLLLLPPTSQQLRRILQLLQVNIEMRETSTVSNAVFYYFAGFAVQSWTSMAPTNTSNVTTASTIAAPNSTTTPTNTTTTNTTTRTTTEGNC